jgi:TonB family protein
MRPCRCGLSLLAVLFFANLSALGARSVAAPAVPPAARIAQPASFERLGALLDQGKVVEGARELTALVYAPAQASAPTSAQAAILHRAVEIGRRHLAVADISYDDSNASRQLVCLGRYRLSEELPEPLGADGQPVPPLHTSNVDRELRRPAIVSHVKAEYTPEARAKRFAGVVVLEIVIDREGCVRNPRVLKGKPYGLNESALASVKSWSFQPATIDGKPVEIYYQIVVNFQEEDSDKVPAKTGSR